MKMARVAKLVIVVVGVVLLPDGSVFAAGSSPCSGKANGARVCPNDYCSELSNPSRARNVGYTCQNGNPQEPSSNFDTNVTEEMNFELACTASMLKCDLWADGEND
jgi:hypothetical protein